MEHVGKVRSIVCFVAFHKNIKKMQVFYGTSRLYKYSMNSPYTYICIWLHFRRGRAIFFTSILAVRDLISFVDQATPGFELGKRGFAVPRLTTRPCRQNDTNKIDIDGNLLLEDLLNPSFSLWFELDLTVSLSFSKRTKSFCFRSSGSLDCIAFQNRHTALNLI